MWTRIVEPTWRREGKPKLFSQRYPEIRNKIQASIHVRTGGDGCTAGEWFQAPPSPYLTAGRHEIFADCFDCNPGWLGINVKHDFVQELGNAPDHPTYVRENANAAHATTGWFGTSTMLGQLRSIADQFFAESAKKCCINDISLPWGGRYDLNSDWKADHIEHLDGNIVDLPYREACIGAAWKTRFQQIVRDHSGDPQDHNGTHFHTIFPF